MTSRTPNSPSKPTTPSDPSEHSAEQPSLRSRQRQDTEHAIRNAALDLFTRAGAQDTTVDEIAQAAGISKRTFFRYFDTKESAAVPSTKTVWPYLEPHFAQVDSIATARQALVAGFHEFFHAQHDRHDGEFQRMQHGFDLSVTDVRVRHELGSAQAKFERELLEALRGRVPTEEHFELRLLINTAVAANRTVWLHWCESRPEDRSPNEIVRLHEVAYDLMGTLFG